MPDTHKTVGGIVTQRVTCVMKKFLDSVPKRKCKIIVQININVSLYQCFDVTNFTNPLTMV